MNHPTPAEVVATVRAHGSNARDLRDAIHEAAHALQVGLTPPWGREMVHKALAEHARADLCTSRPEVALAAYEVQARAVERLACEGFGIPYDPEEWALVAILEASRDGVMGLMPMTTWIAMVDAHLPRAATAELLAQILALRGGPSGASS